MPSCELNISTSAPRHSHMQEMLNASLHNQDRTPQVITQLDTQVILSAGSIVYAQVLGTQMSDALLTWRISVTTWPRTTSSEKGGVGAKKPLVLKM